MEAWAVGGSNDLVFAYDNVESGPLLGGFPVELGNVTIGTENASSTQATALVNRRCQRHRHRRPRGLC